MYLLQINISNIQKVLKESFYPATIMVLLNLVFLVLAITFRKRDSTYQVLIVYSIMALIQDFLMLYPLVTTAKHIKEYFINNINTTIGFFIWTELLGFASIFYIHFKENHIRKTIFLTTIILEVMAIGFMVYYICNRMATQFKMFEGYFSAVAGIFELICAFYYYYSLFVKIPETDIGKDTFWIITGIMFVQAINIPLFLINKYLLQNHFPIYFYLYSINYIAYSLLFILFIVSIFKRNSIPHPIRENHLIK